MKIAAIIAEYNPLHNGHIYHIEETKKITNADYLIVIMSGTFTQNGNISVFDKFKKAQIACAYGADLVLELPTIFATSSSNEFAYGATSILNKLNIVDYLSFGSETGDIASLINISNIITTNKEEINNLIKLELKKGLSYAKARSNALKNFLSLEELKEIEKSNNILAIEYLNNLNKLNASIKPITIARKGNLINDLSSSSSSYISATAIREALKESKECIKEYIPTLSYNSLANFCLNEDIFKILKYKIISMEKEELSNIYGISEGVENRILASISNSNSYEEFIEKIKTKRYQLSRIKRIMINILLSISNELHDELIHNQNSLYAHILASSKKGKKLLSLISKNSDIQVLTSINDTVLSSVDKTLFKNLSLDILSTNIQSVILNENINKDYTNKI